MSKGYGLSVDDIDNSCPSDLQPYAESYKLERKIKDTEAWTEWGNYGLSAILIALEKCLAGSKAKLKYFSHPIMSESEVSNGNKESNEECAIYEMKHRIKLLRESGLPESPD